MPSASHYLPFDCKSDNVLNGLTKSKDDSRSFRILVSLQLGHRTLRESLSSLLILLRFSKPCFCTECANVFTAGGLWKRPDRVDAICSVGRTLYQMESINPENGMGEMSLTKQRSVCNLSLEGCQEALGESKDSFGSMNVDDLLKNLWTAEESQAMVAAMGVLDGSEGALPRQASLQRHGSVTLRNGVGQRSLDDVWKSLSQGLSDTSGVGLSSRDSQQRQPTFGEMTLEDFLVKAGVVKEEDKTTDSSYPSLSFGGTAAMEKDGGSKVQCGVAPGPTVLPHPRTDFAGLPAGKNEQIDVVRSPMQTADLFNGPYHNLSVQQLQQKGHFFQTPGNAGNAVIFPNTQNQPNNGCLMMDSSNFRSLASSVGGPSLNIDSGSSHLRKRSAEGSTERTFERRQRRMIKNRESAARSRERKQAYTVELEDEVSHLKSENLKLRQKQNEAERKKSQVMAFVPVVAQLARSAKSTLRRTHSSPW